jgi:hypothetical protein
MRPSAVSYALLFAMLALTRLAAATIDRDEIELNSLQGQGTRVVLATLVNDWDEPFTITEVKVNCSCIAHDLSTSVVMPHEQSEVFLIVDSGYEVKDKAEKVVIVGRGLSGREQRVAFMVKHKVSPLVRPSRKALVWAKDDVVEPKEVSVTIAPGITTKIVAIQVAEGGNLIVRSEIAPSGDRATAKVTLRNPSQPTHEMLTIVTDHASPSLATFPIICTNEDPAKPGKPAR